MKLGHAHETGIREIHGHIRVFFQQVPDSGRFCLEVECYKKYSFPMKSRQRVARRWRGAEQVPGLGQDSFTGEQRRDQGLERVHGPLVPGIRAVQQGHKRAGIRDDRVHGFLCLRNERPKPLR